jgi:isoleucyl-tRNA synthetase
VTVQTDYSDSLSIHRPIHAIYKTDTFFYWYQMSKSLKNYPDPNEILNKYGADALRLYLINSPVVRAEPLRFKEDGVFQVLKELFLPWYNAYRFLVQNVKRVEVRAFPNPN